MRLDSFKLPIFAQGILADHNLTTETLDAAKDDDEALLMFGLEWIKHMLLDTEVRINHDTKKQSGAGTWSDKRYR